MSGGAEADGPRISVVIPVHNNFALVREAVDSVDLPAEVIVVDDLSEDGTPDRVAIELPHVHLVRNAENLGFGRTANRGLRLAGGDVKVVLNSDARLRPGALARLVSALADPAIGVVGPRLVFPDGSHQLSAARFPSPGRILAGSFLLNDAYRLLRPTGRFRWELSLSRADHERSQDVDWVMGACMALRSELVDQLGGFDPDYFMYMEETDLCLRARRAGWRVHYVADAVVEHRGGASAAGPARHARLMLASEERFMRRCYGPEVLRRWRASRIAGSLLKVAALAPAAPLDRRIRDRLVWQWSALRYSLGDRTAPHSAGTRSPSTPPAGDGAP